MRQRLIDILSKLNAEGQSYVFEEEWENEKKTATWYSFVGQGTDFNERLNIIIRSNNLVEVLHEIVHKDEDLPPVPTHPTVFHGFGMLKELEDVIRHHVEHNWNFIKRHRQSKE